MSSTCTRAHCPRFRTGLLCAVMGVFIAAMASAADDPTAKHPLDPLRQEEIAATVAILKASGKVSDSSRFPIIVLHEPPKDEVLHFKPGNSLRREAFAVVYERASNTTFEAVVDVTNKSVRSWQAIRVVWKWRRVQSEEYVCVLSTGFG